MAAKVQSRAIWMKGVFKLVCFSLSRPIEGIRRQIFYIPEEWSWRVPMQRSSPIRPNRLNHISESGVPYGTGRNENFLRH